MALLRVATTAYAETVDGPTTGDSPEEAAKLELNTPNNEIARIVFFISSPSDVAIPT